jgi:hypothetical protein
LTTLKSLLISPGRHRTQRFPFVAGIQVTDLQTEKQLAAHTEDLSLLGCFVETITPFAEGTEVRLRISRGGLNFVAQGKVTYARPSAGMGIEFISVEPSSLAILHAWLADLRK